MLLRLALGVRLSLTVGVVVDVGDRDRREVGLGVVERVGVRVGVRVAEVLGVRETEAVSLRVAEAVLVKLMLFDKLRVGVTLFESDRLGVIEIEGVFDGVTIPQFKSPLVFSKLTLVRTTVSRRSKLVITMM